MKEPTRKQFRVAVKDALARGIKVTDALDYALMKPTRDAARKGKTRTAFFRGAVRDSIRKGLSARDALSSAMGRTQDAYRFYKDDPVSAPDAPLGKPESKPDGKPGESAPGWDAPKGKMTF